MFSSNHSFSLPVRGLLSKVFSPGRFIIDFRQFRSLKMQQPKAETPPVYFHKFGELAPELRRLVWQTAIDMRSDEIYLVSLASLLHTVKILNKSNISTGITSIIIGNPPVDEQYFTIQSPKPTKKHEKSP